MITKKSIWAPLSFLIVSVLVLGITPQVGAQSKSEKLIGTWKLISLESVLSNGEVSYAWMGKNPVGQTMYDKTGHMSVQLMRDPRPTFASGPQKATPEEIKAAYQGYYSYFATYKTNEREGTIINHITGSLWPKEVGSDKKLFFKFSENRLIITTPLMKRPGKQWFNRMTYERAEKGK
jgi:hypothetical protein